MFSHDTEHSLQTIVDLVNTDPSSTTSSHCRTPPRSSRSSRRTRSATPARLTSDDVAAVQATRLEFGMFFGLADPVEAAMQVNKLIAQATVRPRLTNHDGYDWHLHYFSPDASLADHLAVDGGMAVAQVVTAGEIDRLRVCDAPTCRAVLLDLSRNSSKRYCDASTCGNRLHVAAYRGAQALRAARATGLRCPASTSYGERHSRPHEAWRRVTDWERHGEFVPLTRMRVDRDPATGQLSFVARTSVGPLGFDDVMAVTYSQPPTETEPGVVRIVKQGKVVLGWAVLTVTPAGSGSEVRWHEEARLRCDPWARRRRRRPGGRTRVRPAAGRTARETGRRSNSAARDRRPTARAGSTPPPDSRGDRLLLAAGLAVESLDRLDVAGRRRQEHLVGLGELRHRDVALVDVVPLDTSSRVMPARHPADKRRGHDDAVEHAEDVAAGALAEHAGRVGEDRLARLALGGVREGDHVLAVRRRLEPGERPPLVARPGHGRRPRSTGRTALASAMTTSVGDWVSRLEPSGEMPAV